MINGKPLCLYFEEVDLVKILISIEVGLMTRNQSGNHNGSYHHDHRLLAPGRGRDSQGVKLENYDVAKHF